MLRQRDETKPRTMSDLAGEVLESEADRRVCRVIVEGLSNRIETPEAFAIKFSLLSHVPVTRMKHLMKQLPAVLWQGRGRSRAAGLLRMIEEAGGKGRIEDVDPAEAVEKQRPRAKSGPRACAVCGFPLKREDAFCDFCLTPVEPGAAPQAAAPLAARPTGRSPYLWLFLILCGAAVAMILAVLR